MTQFTRGSGPRRARGLPQLRDLLCRAQVLDVVVALTENHVALSRLADGVRRARHRWQRNVLFDDLARGLGGHFEGLECVVLPNVPDLPGRPVVCGAVLRGFVRLEHQLAVLLAMDRMTDKFEEALMAFCTAVEEQADLEQLELVPVLRDLLNEEERFFLGPGVNSCMQRRLGERHLDGVATSEPPSSSVEELEEAVLILSSLSLLRRASPSDTRQGDEHASS